jgi:hypothetical protein
MPINFAFALDRLIQAPHEQNLIIATLQNTGNINVNLDYTGGALTDAAKTGIDKRPGTPSVSDKNLVFPLNRYFTSKVPCVSLCPKAGLAEVIEVMLDQKFYQVICVENFGGGGPAADWKPHMIQPIAQARDFSKWQENDAQLNRDAKAPPAPINAPANPQGSMGSSMGAPVVNDSSPYANQPAEGNYANQPGQENPGFVNPQQVLQRRATV